MALYSSQYKYLFVALGVGVSLAGTFVQKSGLLPNSMVKAQEETTNVGTEEETQVQIAKTHLKQTTDSSGEDQHEFAEPNEETETHVDEVKNREKTDNPAQGQASEIRETTGEPILPDKGWEVNRIQEDTLIPTPETKPLTIKVKEPPVQSAQIKEASLKEEIHEIVSDDTEEDKKVLTENHIPSKTSTSFGKNWFSMNAEASSITEEGYEWSINDCVESRKGDQIIFKCNLDLVKSKSIVELAFSSELVPEQKQKDWTKLQELSITEPNLENVVTLDLLFSDDLANPVKIPLNHLNSKVD